jgi:hypothetical protein
MKPSLTPIALIGLSLILAIANLVQFNGNRRLRERLAVLEAEPVAASGSLAGAAADQRGAKARADGGGTVVAGGGDESKLAGIKPRKQEGGESFSDLAERYAKSVQDNPAMQKQMLAQFEAQLGDVLEGLYEHFELEGEELTHFQGLIAEHWRVQSQVPMQLMSAMGDPEKVDAIKVELEKSRESTDARIQEFLNDDEDFAYFETYRDQLPDRMEVNQYQDAMDSGGIPISSEQEAQLIAAMAEERKASGLGDVNDPMQWDMEEFNEGSITEVMGMMGDFHSRVQVRAGGILDQGQVAALAESQNDIRQQQELGMRFGLQMMEAMRPGAKAEGVKAAPEGE